MTYSNDLAYDLIHKVKIASKELPQLFVYIRRHPLLNYKELEQLLTEINFTNFEYADEMTIQYWLPNIDIVISSEKKLINKTTFFTILDSFYYFR